jgi:signal transduction histidine kinase
MAARDLVWGLPLTAFVMVGTFFAGGGHDGLPATGWVGVVLAGAAALGLLVGRRWPTGALLVPGVLVATYFALGLHDGPIYLPLLLGSFLAARRGSLRRWVPMVAATLALVVLGMGIRAATTDLGWWQPFWQALGTCGLTLAAGLLGGLAHSRRQTAEERVARAATEEKLRMAQDLHDGVGHGLAVIAMQAGVALHVLEKDQAAARRALEAIRDTSKESLAALRSELSVLAGEPAARTPRRGLDDLPELTARVRAAGLEVRRSGTAGGELPADVDEAAYGLVQEALTNVLRHSDATTVDVRLDRADSALVVTVVDDGRGGEVQDEGMGISGMRDRVTALGGSVAVGPREGRGFEVRATLPVPAP